ncbi:hypothetical protein EV191_1011110 [Tamaricihabitans halophyticus]|uniref:DUF6194 domain-containing protein n=2 Tax=Tamaricihabitans halophyticus TaxID=1262583 RepID=A0A4R2R5U4_9PSEU|nr:hypothetical protein EV191_1011110 [Tamaricihabitans halophyticus]
MLTTIRALDGVFELAPTEGSEFPEVAWGDHFFYYAKDNQLPQREQPYATIITKNYLDDSGSGLDQPDRWRLNIHVGRTAYTELIGTEPAVPAEGTVDYAAVDTVLPHPLYARQGWIAIVNPGERTWELAVTQVGEAHEAARRRATKRRPTE